MRLHFISLTSLSIIMQTVELDIHFKLKILYSIKTQVVKHQNNAVLAITQIQQEITYVYRVSLALTAFLLTQR